MKWKSWKSERSFYLLMLWVCLTLCSILWVLSRSVPIEYLFMFGVVNLERKFDDNNDNEYYFPLFKVDITSTGKRFKVRKHHISSWLCSTELNKKYYNNIDNEGQTFHCLRIKLKNISSSCHICSSTFICIW